MPRGNPNFKKKEVEQEIERLTQELKDDEQETFNQELKEETERIEQENEVISEVKPLEVTPEPINPEPITDQTVLEDFAKLERDLLEMQKIKLAIKKPNRHYFAISRQVQMWGRNFERTLR